ncbi:MAG: 16S rRNA (guanine(527)-N(7))-methyltransferase RsmG [Ignavibacteriales bacterium]|nr:16S rRNA (guanine(527)-N(7))-methyltransferase RsmG [Ignavibacteriales bacterium]
MERKNQHDTQELGFLTTCRKNGLVVEDEKMLRLSRYAGCLMKWNQKINLISRKDEENLWQNHILQSISPLFKIFLNSGLRVLDLGTGGGLPGIPWSILFDECEFLLLDATKKKVEAVAQMIEYLAIRNAHTVWGRAEDMGHQHNFKKTFDVVVSRAVAPLRDLIDWSAPFLISRASLHVGEKPDQLKLHIRSGSLLAFKGGDIDKEISSAKLKHPTLTMKAINLSFNGSESLPFVDKKLVIVEF